MLIFLFLLWFPSPDSILPNPAVNRQTRRFLPCARSGCLLLMSFFLCIRAVHSAQENFMSAEAARRAPLMPLKELVVLYRSLAGEFGKPVALSAFPLSPAETR